jgi:hypothetical protein
VRSVPTETIDTPAASKTVKSAGLAELAKSVGASASATANNHAAAHNEGKQKKNKKSRKKGKGERIIAEKGPAKNSSQESPKADGTSGSASRLSSTPRPAVFGQNSASKPSFAASTVSSSTGSVPKASQTTVSKPSLTPRANHTVASAPVSTQSSSKTSSSSAGFGDHNLKPKVDYQKNPTITIRPSHHAPSLSTPIARTDHFAEVDNSMDGFLSIKH